MFGELRSETDYIRRRAALRSHGAAFAKRSRACARRERSRKNRAQFSFEN
jgi:hypothetical protein